jgi:transcriptional regulator with XRE-family HTH domain
MVVVMLSHGPYDQRTARELPTKLGAYLRDLRLARGYTARVAGRKAGLSRMGIAALENRTLVWANFRVVKRIARAYDLDPREVLNGLYDKWEEDNVRTR